MSTDSSVTMGAAASKKESPSRPVMRTISPANASLVRGPVAMTVGPSGRRVTSPSITRQFGCPRSALVTPAENCSRSTAIAPPAGTRAPSAQVMISEPMRRISSLSSPTAFSTRSLRRELEHTSSAKPGMWCAGVYFCGFISYRFTA